MTTPTRGFVDIHCHVLPGVDDGAADPAQSLTFLRRAAADGTRAIIATPHQHPSRYPNRAALLRDAHARLLDAIAVAREAGEDLPDVHLGAEVHLDEGLPALVESGERLRLAGSSHLLLELPDAFPIAAIEQLVFELQLQGITPVLAHPERIRQFLRQPDQLRRLVERGALGQATGSSVAGVFGAPCREATMTFLSEGLIHVVASDAHDDVRRTTSLTAAAAALSEAFGEAFAREVLVTRPAALLEGRPVSTDPPPAREPDPGAQGTWAALRRLFGG